MLRRLRWRLTGAYLLATLLLVSMVGAGAYYVLLTYFSNTTDMTIQHQMALQFNLFGVELPDELVQAEQQWFETQFQNSANSNFNSVQSTAAFEEWYAHEREEDYEEEMSEHAFESGVVANFILPLDSSGALIFNPNPFIPPMEPDVDASQAALQNGSDWRTVRLPSGSRARLYSFATSDPGAPAVLQIGRLLNDHDDVLRQLVLGILFVGGFSVLLVGSGSWWLAGRTLMPAQRAWDNQHAFIANASHELRTPLTLIRASTEVALRGKLPKKERALLQDVVEESDYMNRLVEDLLLLSRLDANRLEMEEALVSISALLEDIARQLEPLVDKKQIKLELVKGEGYVRGDKTRLRQVLLILLDNALQHTLQGGVVHLVGQLRDKQIAMVVEDNGVGISAEHLPHIFDRFYQGSNGVDDDSRSNGLGLSIAQGLVEAHGGTIKVESTLGQGTKFTIALEKTA